MTSYTNLFPLLNPQLYNTKSIERQPNKVHSKHRNPPKILIRENDIFEGLAKFQHTDSMYLPHTAWFPDQVVDVRVPVTGIVKLPKIIDLNYLWCTEYFHFFTEVLPNALFLFNKGIRYPIFCKTSFFSESALRWFGITNQIISALPPLRTEQHVPLYVECGNPSFQKIRLLRDVVESKVHFESTHGILLRRHGTRELLNESEVFDFFQEKYPQLTWVIFDILSIEDTANLFSKAAMIVAPHGAGLTNMIFAPKGVEILEFMPASDPNVCYWHLSEMLENSYKMFPVECNKYRSMKVDIDELKYYDI
jgi:capsular polysaccharide biosynthesis protein